mgnify:FL=1
MAKANCGASMKPQQKNTPKMAMGGMMGKMGNAQQQRKAPQSVQAMTAQSSAGARRQQRKYS